MSLWPAQFLPGKRIVTFNTATEWTTALVAALYAQGAAGIAVTVIMTRALMSCAITMSLVVIDTPAPDITGPDELLFGIQGVAKGVLPTSTEPVEISIASDANPGA